MKPARQPGAPNSSRRYSQPVAVGTGVDGGRRNSEISTSSSASNLRGNDVTTPGQPAAVDDKPDGRPRRSRASKDLSSDSPSFDPEHYNPDGSLRTIHKMPNFNDSYAEASKARYIRHRQSLDREKELSVNQVFENS